ncbi:MAG: succinate dehydrogenase assembly factor 2 [Alphaproteobacteria bacterium]|nr:succinate dehydrogenase assembly factor 2 [Alphaproteobacteria bacterium]
MPLGLGMDIETRKKRILYRSAHRGTKESDVIVGGFFTMRTPGLAETQLDDAERILDLHDVDLMDWIIKRLPVPDEVRSPLLDELVSYGRGMG